MHRYASDAEKEKAARIQRYASDEKEKAARPKRYASSAEKEK